MTALATAVGGLPATAAVTFMAAGEPETVSVVCERPARPGINSKTIAPESAIAAVDTPRAGRMPYTPPVIVYVTTRVVDVTTPAAVVASS